jgi:hypothetical protein
LSRGVGWFRQLSGAQAEPTLTSPWMFDD